MRKQILVTTTVLLSIFTFVFLVAAILTAGADTTTKLTSLATLTGIAAMFIGLAAGFLYDNE